MAVMPLVVENTSCSVSSSYGWSCAASNEPPHRSTTCCAAVVHRTRRRRPPRPGRSWPRTRLAPAPSPRRPSRDRRSAIAQASSTISRSVSIGLDGVRADRVDRQHGDAGLLERADALLDVALRADEVRQLEPLARHRGGGLVLLALEVQVLHLDGLLLVAVGAGDVVVEVLAAGAHAADVQRDARAGRSRGSCLLLVADEVVADRQHAAGRDVELLAARVALGEAGLQLRCPTPAGTSRGRT